MNSPLNCSHCWCQRTTIQNVPHKVCCMCQTRLAIGTSPNPWRGPFRPLRPDEIRYLEQHQKELDHPDRKINEIPWLGLQKPRDVYWKINQIPWYGHL